MITCNFVRRDETRRRTLLYIRSWKGEAKRETPSGSSTERVALRSVGEIIILAHFRQNVTLSDCALRAQDREVQNMGMGLNKQPGSYSIKKKHSTK